MSETQESICQWANETFGEPITNESIAWRAKHELDELIDVLYDDDNAVGAPVEAADVIIVLMRIFAAHGVNFWDVVEAKMEINRGRQWVSTGDGHGRHVK